MAILNIVSYPTGVVGVNPSIVYIDTNDTLVTVLTTGYLNKAVQQGYVFNESMMACVSTKTAPNATSTQVAWLEVSKSGANWSLVPTGGSGSVILPTIPNHIATYTNTTGTLSEDPATAISGGNIQAGLSGTAGLLASFPTTAARGSLRLAAVANTGNTNTTISNAAMGQASVITIPDPAGATANFAIAPAALVNNNLVKASGVAGLVADAGFAAANVMLNNAVNTMTNTGGLNFFKSNGTEAANAVTTTAFSGMITTSALTTAGGASYAITWTNTAFTTSTYVGISLAGGTNTVNNITIKCVPSAGTATLTIYNNTAASALNGTIIINYVLM